MKLSTFTKGLVLHQPLEQEYYNSNTKRFTDKSAYRNHGTSFNAGINFVADRMGQSSRAAAFNGSSDYINCGNDSSLNITDEITISFWVKFLSLNTMCGFVSKGGNGGRSPFNVSINNDVLYFLQSQNGNDWTTLLSVNQATSGIVVDTWYNIVCFGNGTDAIMYLDTVQIGIDTTPAAPMYINTTDVTIGAEIKPSDSTVGRYFNGNIADVRIYNRVLSEAEIALLFNSYNPRTIIW